MPYFKTLIASILLAAPALAIPYPSLSPFTAEHVKPPQVHTPFTSPEPLVDPVAPAKTPCPHAKVSPEPMSDSIYTPPIESPEPVVDPVYLVESPEPVVDPVYPVESPEPFVDPVYPVESPEPVVDPIYTPPVQSPEPAVDPIYTPPVESPEPIVDPVYPIESPEPVADPIYTPTESPVPEEDIFVPEDTEDEYDDDDENDRHEKDIKEWDNGKNEYDEDEEAPTPVYTPLPLKKHVEKKEVKEGKVGHCYLQSVDFGKYTAEQCCEVRFSCDSPHCAHNYACKHNSDVCHCHKTVCKKIYLLASYKPVHKIHPSCSDDVFALH